MKISNKSYFQLTDEEIEKLAKLTKLTPKEKVAVDALVAAVKALPPTICFEVTDNFHGDGNLHISKRITKGSCQSVAKLKKASIHF